MYFGVDPKRPCTFAAAARTRGDRRRRRAMHLGRQIKNRPFKFEFCLAKLSRFACFEPSQFYCHKPFDHFLGFSFAAFIALAGKICALDFMSRSSSDHQIGCVVCFLNCTILLLLLLLSLLLLLLLMRYRQRNNSI